MITPIRMPGTKPQMTMIAMMATSDRIQALENRLRDPMIHL